MRYISRAILFFLIFHLLEVDILFEDIALFITGVRVVPPSGIPKKITVSFVHECPTGCQCKLTVSTCALKLSSHSHHQAKEDMKKAISDSIKLGDSRN